MNRNIGIIVIVAIVLVGVFVLVRRPVNNTSTTQPQPTAEIKAQSTATPAASPSGAIKEETGAVKEFTVTGSNFVFDPAEIRVKEGDTVKINFKNSGGFHDWKIDEFNATTKVISSGQTDTVQFVADKKGTFEYYCSVGNHRAMGMKGNLIVE